MTLKSYRLKDSFKKRAKKVKRSIGSGTKDVITGGVTALVGIGLLSETSNLVAGIS